MSIEQGGSPNVLDPATESKQDEIIENQTDGSQKTQIVGSTGNVAEVNEDNQLHVVLQGKEDVNNSSTTPLVSGGVFTGESTDISAYSAITILVSSDVASTTNGLTSQFSSDGLSWHDGEAYTIAAGATKFFTPPVQAKYFRIVYTNGSTEQSVFYLHVMLKKSPIKWSSHNIEDPITDEDDAELSKSVITGKKSNGDYDNVSLTNSGNMKISLEELENQISVNGNTQLRTTIFDEGGVPASVDDSTESLQVIDYAHHEIHGGSSFWYDDVVVGSAAIEYLITTPDTTKWAHFGYEIESSVAGYTIEFYEATDKNGATLQTAYDRNRNTDNTPTVTIHKGLTGGVIDGTRILWHISGTTTSGGKVGGSSNDATERVLKQNTKYIVRITPLSSNTVSVRFNWYEHTNKN